MSLDEGLEQESYAIEDELRIRKKLEQNTNWDFEFTKNDKYQYDMRLYRWSSNPSSPDDREVFGYIELERARKTGWCTGDVPDNWVYITFLERKIRDYDYKRGAWDGLKDDYQRTVYLKFNHALDNCFVAPIASVHRDGNQTKRSTGSPTDTYRALPFDHPDVQFGIGNAVEFIEDYLSSVDAEQTGFEEFSSGTDRQRVGGRQ